MKWWSELVKPHFILSVMVIIAISIMWSTQRIAASEAAPILTLVLGYWFAKSGSIVESLEKEVASAPKKVATTAQTIETAVSNAVRPELQSAVAPLAESVLLLKNRVDSLEEELL